MNLCAHHTLHAYSTYTSKPKQSTRLGSFVNTYRYANTYMDLMYAVFFSVTVSFSLHLFDVFV